MGKKRKKSAVAGKIRLVTSKIPLVRKIELWPIDKLRPYAKNSRTHSDSQVAEIAASYRAYGMNQPILWSDEIGIVAGEGRYLAAKLAGLSHVPVIRANHLSKSKARGYLIADNKLAEHAGWNFKVLADELKELEELGEDLTSTGFSEDELSNFLAEDTDLDKLYSAEPINRALPKENSQLPDQTGPITTPPPEPLPKEITAYEPLKFDSDGLNLKFKVQNADCLEFLKTLPADSIESLVTDPPAGISFMGKAWDDDKGGRNQWIAWLTDVMKEALRVLKPGAHGLVWALPRTSHWTGNAIENAGFEIRDVVLHLFGSGFPKSLDVSKAIDKSNGDERQIIGKRTDGRYGSKFQDGNNQFVNAENNSRKKVDDKIGLITLPASAASAASAAWEGWGTALKPASEHWFLIRKPLGEGTVAKNVLKHGTGGINIDASRIGTEERFNPPTHKNTPAAMGDFSMCKGEGSTVKGRFPANLVLSHNENCKEISEGKRAEGKRAEGKRVTTDMGQQVRERPNSVVYKYDVAPVWECVDGCPIKELDRQSGQSGQFAGQLGMKAESQFAFSSGEKRDYKQSFVQGVKDFGGASRFFYIAKPAASEKHAGLDGFYNTEIDCAPCEENMGLVQSHLKAILELIPNLSIVESGEHIMVMCPKDFLSTTKTILKQITESKTWNWLTCLLTSDCTQDVNCEEVPGLNYVLSAKHLNEWKKKIGISLVKVGSVTDDAENATLRKLLWLSEENAWKQGTCTHPTVKPVRLMQYFCKMVTPPGGTVLDVFAGSGTTGIAALSEGFNFIGIEQDLDSATIARNRIQSAFPKATNELNPKK